jgi:hypothetical protein
MVTKKYANDYRLENVLAPGGKLKTVAVYRGSYFRFLAPAESIRRLKYLYLGSAVLAAGFWLALMFLNLRRAEGSWALLLPAGIGIFAMFYEGCGIWRLFTAGEKVTREHNDKLYKRLSAASMCHLILGGLGAVGGVVLLLRNPFRVLYLIAVLLCAAWGLCAVPMFILRSRLQMEEIV